MLQYGHFSKHGNCWSTRLNLDNSTQHDLVCSGLRQMGGGTKWLSIIYRIRKKEKNGWNLHLYKNCTLYGLRKNIKFSVRVWFKAVKHEELPIKKPHQLFMSCTKHITLLCSCEMKAGGRDGKQVCQECKYIVFQLWLVWTTLKFVENVLVTFEQLILLCAALSSQGHLNKSLQIFHSQVLDNVSPY